MSADLDAGTLAEDEIDELAELVEQAERLERIHRAEVDLLYFAHEYFSDVRNEDNDGNWDGFDIATPEDAAEFHAEICAIIDDVSCRNTNGRVAVAAPRGHAKSSYLTKASPLREVAFRKRKYIIIISETPSVATSNLEWIADQMKGNEKLRKDFGPLLHPKQQMNPRDNNAEFIAWEPKANSEQRQRTLVQAASSNQAIRGRNWNGGRPDLIICDDLEDPKTNAGTKEQREKLKDWFSQSVMPLGDPKGKKTAFIYMGTIVHGESLLNGIIKNRADFKSTLYKALIREPDRMDLWEECRAIYTDQNMPVNDRADKAKEFYEAHREEMNEGAEVLWSEVQPLWKLMNWKWDEGSKAFNTEYQNTPLDEEAQVFKLDEFFYYADADIADIPLKYFAGIDVAMGKEKGDYSAIITLGLSPNGILYVVDAFLERVHPDVLLKKAVELTLKYQYESIAVEAQVLQEFFADKLTQELHANRYPAVTRLKKIQQRSRKALRIESLLPDVQSGRLRFSKKHHLLLEMFEYYPNHSHDDAEDATQMALSVASKGNKRKASTTGTYRY